MSDIAINVEKLSKQYRIGHSGKNPHYKTFRETLMKAIVTPLHWAKGYEREKNLKTIWALKDVSFEIKRGEVVGIIGHNGAGKSTLLKIISRITDPSEGSIDIYGRIGSLLEVGTGFHPELTGRENIYLNGAILGMKKAEIDKKFDEIVDFSEVETFIDTPVKHFSSGMYLRLAFAVAAHLEPEILTVDEVLAVGDVAFQKKCLGKMRDIAHGGRTVLFVSHNMQVISNLCQSCLLLSSGRLIADGNVQDVITKYLSVISSDQSRGIIDLDSDRILRSGSGSSRFLGIYFYGEEGLPKSIFQVGEQFNIQFSCRIDRLDVTQFYQIRIKSITGTPIFHWIDFDSGLESCKKEGIDRVAVKLDKLLLYPGRYVVSIMASDRYGTGYDYIENAATFDVVEGSLIPLQRQYFPTLGIIHIVPEWVRL